MALITIAFSQVSNANNEQQPSERRGPPPAAFTACEGKIAGDQSQFETRRGETLTGTCEEARGKNAGKLVLRPNNRRTPPQEAYAACEGKSSGDISQFKNRRGETLKGTCQDMDGKLVLRPERFTQ